MRSCLRSFSRLPRHGWVGRLENGGWTLLCDPPSNKIADIARSYLANPESLSREPAYDSLSSLMNKVGLQMDQALQMSLHEVIVDEWAI